VSVKMRQRVEREIAASAVDALIRAGFAISVDNGDNDGRKYEIANSTDRAAIAAKMFQTDEERVYAVDKADNKPIGWLYFVYGNDGWDVLSDYTVNLEQIIGEGTATQRLIDEYAD
jgi:hypothetical protein